MAHLTTLDRELFSITEAARVLDVPASTLQYWLEGGVRDGHTYQPVLRPEASGSKIVTWGEFVEAALLRQYRRRERVRLQELRSFVQLVRERTGAPYPLADRRPYVGEGARLLDTIQEELELDGHLRLVTSTGGQYVLLPAADNFVHRVEWKDDQAAAWRPHDDAKSPVRVDPEVRFGRPSVKGVSTDVLWEQVEAGATSDEVATNFGLDSADVDWACAYETSARAPARAA